MFLICRFVARNPRRGSQVTSILYFFDDFDWMGDAKKKGKEKGENTGKTHKKTTWQPLLYTKVL